jgi:hypothetical protein
MVDHHIADGYAAQQLSLKIRFFETVNVASANFCGAVRQKR